MEFLQVVSCFVNRMRFLNNMFFVVFLVFTQCCGAILQNDRFKVHVGYRVNIVDETITVRSAPICAAACTAKNVVTPNSCVTLTYNSVTNECLLSSKKDATAGLGSAYKTMANEADCSLPPPVDNGVLVITSQNSTGSLATLTCDGGYIPGTNSDLNAQCSNIFGWESKEISCTFLPETSYYGTSFIFGYIANGASNNGLPTFYIVCQHGEVTVKISIPYLSIDEQATTVGGVLIKQYTNTLTSYISGSFSTKAVFITTNAPVVIFSGNMKPAGGSDGSFILPEASLGNTYVISGHPSSSSGSDEFLVVGTVDSTQVTLTTKAGSSETITLNRLQTYYKTASDMSGSIISANASLFVLSGHSCANIPDNSVSYCDYIDAAIPPVSALGTAHIVSYMKPRSEFTVSVVAPYNQTSVTITDNAGNQIELFFLNERNSAFRTYTGSSTISITTSSPVLVTQYGHGSALVFGDPSMMIIPDVTFFGHVYDFSVPTGFNTPSTLQIIISNSYALSGLLLNDVSITPTEMINSTIPNHGSFTILYVDVVTGKYRVTHSQGNLVTFGAWLYGRTNNQEYATNLGIKV